MNGLYRDFGDIVACRLPSNFNCLLCHFDSRFKLACLGIRNCQRVKESGLLEPRRFAEPFRDFKGFLTRTKLLFRMDGQDPRQVVVRSPAYLAQLRSPFGMPRSPA